MITYILKYRPLILFITFLMIPFFSFESSSLVSLFSYNSGSNIEKIMFLDGDKIFDEIMNKFPISETNDYQNYNKYKKKLLFLKNNNLELLFYLKDIYFGLSGLDYRTEAKIGIRDKEKDIEDIISEIKEIDSRFNYKSFNKSLQIEIIEEENSKIDSIYFIETPLKQLENKTKLQLNIEKRENSNDKEKVKVEAENDSIQNFRLEMEKFTDILYKNKQNIKDHIKKIKVIDAAFYHIVKAKERFNNEIINLKNQLLELEKEIKKFENQKQEISNNISSDQNINFLLSEVELVKSEVRPILVVMSKVSKNRKTIKRLEEEIRLMESDGNSIVNNDGKEFNRNQKSIIESREKIYSLSAENKKVVSSLSIFQKKNYKKNKDKIKGLKSKINFYVMKKQDEIKNIDNKLFLTTNKLKFIEKKVTIANEKYFKFKKENDLAKNISSKKNENEKDKLIVEKRNEITNLENFNEILTSKIDRLEFKISIAEKAKDERIEREKKITALLGKKRIKEIKDNGKLKAKITNNRNNDDKLILKLESVKSDNSKKNNKKVQSLNSLSKLKKKLKRYKFKLSNLKKDYKNIDLFYSIKDALQSDIKELNRQIKYTSDIKNTNQNNSGTKYSIIELESRIEKSKAEIKELSSLVYIPNDEVYFKNDGDLIILEPDINTEIYKDKFMALVDFFDIHSKLITLETFDIINYMDIKFEKSKDFKKRKYSINDKFSARYLLKNLDRAEVLESLLERYFDSIKSITNITKSSTYDKHLFQNIKTLDNKNIFLEIYFDEELYLFKDFIEYENSNSIRFDKFEEYGLYAYWVKLNSFIDKLVNQAWDDEIKRAIVESGNKKLPAKIDELESLNDFDFENNLKKYNKFLTILLYDLKEATTEVEKVKFKKLLSRVHNYIIGTFERDISKIKNNISDILIYSIYNEKQYLSVKSQIDKLELKKDEQFSEKESLLRNYIDKIYDPNYNFMDNELEFLIDDLDYYGFYPTEEKSSYITKLRNLLDLKENYNKNYVKNIGYKISSTKIYVEDVFFDKVNSINENLIYIKKYLYSSKEKNKITIMMEKVVSIYQIYDDLTFKYKGVLWPYKDYMNLDYFTEHRNITMPKVIDALDGLLTRFPEKREFLNTMIRSRFSGKDFDRAMQEIVKSSDIIPTQ